MVTAIQTMQSSVLTSQPQSPATTAPVREHVCLFTHDLRRKQKRWQDGRLKYHTFNRRVMVYDERGNYIGDTHWREDYNLADGEEVELERGGIMVQVGECVNSHDQDLSELIDKRAQEKALRQAAAALVVASREPPTTPIATHHVLKPSSLLPQKHLHSVIGTPSGHHGRAVLPKQSPYEERQQRLAAPQSDDARSVKRQRRDVSPPSKSGYAQNLFGATLTLSGRPSSQGTARPRPPRIVHAREESTSPPSSDTNHLNGRQVPKMKKAQEPVALNVPKDYPSGQRTGLFDPTQTSKKTGPSLHSFTKPDIPVYPNANLAEQLRKRPTPQRQLSNSNIRTEKETIDRHYVQDLRSADPSLEQSCSETGRSGEQPPAMLSKKSRDKRRSGAGIDPTLRAMTGSSNMTDLTEDGAEVSNKQPIPEEPRTELRIKPRKKRGLLMVTEQYAMGRHEAASTGPSTVTTVPLSKSAIFGTSSNVGGEVETSSRAERDGVDLHDLRRRDIILETPVDRGADDGNDDDGCQQGSSRVHCRHFGIDDESNEIRRPDQSNVKAQREPRNKVVNEHSEGHTIETPVIETMRRLRPKRQHSSEKTVILDHVDEAPRRPNPPRREGNTPVDEMPAPRLAKLGRKSIKSREVIGFIFEEEPDPIVSIKPSLDSQPFPPIGKQPYQPDTVVDDSIVTPKAQVETEAKSPSNGSPAVKGPVVLQKQDSGTLKTLENEAAFLNHSGVSTSMLTVTTTTKQPVPRIINPATRGKRAAKPSDAAGQIPICPLPTEPVGRSSVLPGPRNMNVLGNLDKETATPIPVFSRASGGPWSREAHDLFDFKRPS